MEQLRVILDQHRTERRGSDPELNAICAAFRGVDEDRRVYQSAPVERQIESGGRVFGTTIEWAMYHDINPHLWLDTPECPPAVAERVRRIAKDGGDDIDKAIAGLAEGTKDAERKNTIQRLAGKYS